MDLEEIQSATEETRRKKLAKEVTEDFLRRREKRKNKESGWLLDMRFIEGDQYCDILPSGEVGAEEKRYYWQSRKVFNRIATTVESRIAKLVRVRPKMHVKAFSDEEGDIKAAKLASGILGYVEERVRLNDLIARALLWSETCGTVFYKIVWENEGGRKVAEHPDGTPVYEGDIDVVIVPPFEIYPDRLDAESLTDVKSLIHARNVDVSYVKEKFGVEVPPDDLEDTKTLTDGKRVVLIERYTRPTADNAEGKLEIVAGKMLLYESGLPYANGDRGERTFPFVQQNCLNRAGEFFGTSVVDRLIPVQRAYNAVRNRKQEFLNRIAVGVLAVEDGSVDVDELAEEGIAPGKIIVFRQGAQPPKLLDARDVPAGFSEEEEWLEKEFSVVSGVSDVGQNSSPVRVTSATGLQLLLSQDDLRLSATTDNMISAVRAIGRQTVRLYREFAGNARLLAVTGEDKKTQLFYFNAKELSCDDIVFETEDAKTPEQRREIILQLFEAGLLSDKNGQTDENLKSRILDAFGFGSYENAKDISKLQTEKAEEENLACMRGEKIGTEVYDDHDTHISEHVRFLLTTEGKKMSDCAKNTMLAHLSEHKNLSKKINEKSIKEDQ